MAGLLSVRLGRLAAVCGCAFLTGWLTGCNFEKDDNASLGSKGLWIANGTNVVEYNPAQLVTGATPPHVAINSAVFGMPQGMAFDPLGNLWVLDPAGMVNGVPTPALFEFSAAQVAALRSDNAPDPVAVITATALKSPRQAVIDVLGNAWITDHDNNTVLGYTASQLMKTGANVIEPAAVISSTQFNGPSGIAFDSKGNMWVANTGTATTPGTTVVEITSTHVPALPLTGTTTTTLSADAVVSDNGQMSIQAPWGLGFDSHDTLWLANSNTPFTVVSIANAGLVTGAPTPSAVISSATVGGNPSLDGPNGLCVDDAGNVAVVDSAGAFGIAFYSAKQLVTGSPVPAAFVAGSATTLNMPAGCTFGPVVP